MLWSPGTGASLAASSFMIGSLQWAEYGRLARIGRPDPDLAGQAMIGPSR